ncbi:hypothetical protein KL910_004768 [Ogataea haglerorum]|nr:hypothetical protein KL945_004153 [Ogataea haglerorum]KAG7785388.1 hypothetical protein KL910_004768 [Ogataea haglerorum]
MRSRAHIPMHLNLEGIERLYSYQTCWNRQAGRRTENSLREAWQHITRQLHEDLLELKYLRHRQRSIDLCELQRVQLEYSLGLCTN